MSLDDIEKVAHALTPPEWNPSRRLKFDLAVIFTIGVIGMGLALHTAIACGFMTALGIPGFAMASDVAAQQGQLTAIQQDQKQQVIDRDQRQICMARVAKNQAAMSAWNYSLQHDITAYWQIPQIKMQPQIRSCEELLITSD